MNPGRVGLSAPPRRSRVIALRWCTSTRPAQRSVPLADRVLVTIGRRPEADISLPWDSEVSRLHAELLDRASEWLIIDDGLSQNGTYVNGVRVEGRRRLADGDLITIGRTSLTYCDPRSPPSTSRLH